MHFVDLTTDNQHDFFLFLLRCFVFFMIFFLSLFLIFLIAFVGVAVIFIIC